MINSMTKFGSSIYSLGFTYHHVIPPLFTKDRAHLFKHVLQTGTESRCRALKNEQDDLSMSKLIVKDFHHLLNILIVFARRITKSRCVNNLGRD